MTKQTFWRRISFPTGLVDLRSIGNQGVVVPHGTTAERPSAPLDGTLRYNTNTNASEIYQSGSWANIQTALTSGEANTASNLGAGQAIFASKAGVDLRFKSIVGGTNVTVGSNANEIIINSPAVGEANTASNIGAGTGTIFDSKLGVDLQFKSLTSLSPNLTIVNNGSEIEFDLTGLASGEANTGTNVGAGSEVFKDKLSTTLRFRTLVAATNEISLAQSANEINIGIADNPVIPGTGSITVPVGPTASEPAASNGMIRYDSDTNQLRAVISGSWETLVTSLGTYLSLSGGSMTGDINLTSGADIIGGVGSQIQLQDDFVLISGANIDMSAGGNIIMQAAATVDGRDISADGATLDNINQTGAFGIVARTGDPNTFNLRSIAGASNEISITNGNGVSGNPTVGIADNPTIPGNEAIRVPSGTTGQRPGTPGAGQVRFNSDNSEIEFYTGAAWFSFITTNSGAVTGDIDMGGNSITNINQVDGRDVSADGAIIDELTAITTDTGVVVRSGGTFVSRLIQASATDELLGANVANGDGSGIIEIGVDIANLTPTGGLSSADQIIVYDDAGEINLKATISDITALLSSTGLDAEIDVTGEFGFLARIADGTPGDFERRTITVSSAIATRGLTITNGDGVAGDPVIGLDITGLASAASIDDNTEIVVHETGAGENGKTTIGSVRDQLLQNNFRASSTAVAVGSGVSQLPFAIGANDFNPSGNFSDAGDSFTPVAGTYRIGAYVEVDASTVAGTYVVKIRKNGSPVGNLGVVEADAANTFSVLIDDLLEANGTDAFTVEIDNQSGMASTLAVARFFGHRIY